MPKSEINRPCVQGTSLAPYHLRSQRSHAARKIYRAITAIRSKILLKKLLNKEKKNRLPDFLALLWQVQQLH